VVVYGYDGRRRFSVRGTTAVWSPDGRLAVSGRDAGAQGPYGVTRIVGEHGGPARRAPGFPLAWSPDGRRLLLATNERALVAIDPSRRLLAHYDGAEVSFIGSNEVVAEDEQFHEWKIPLAGGSARPYPLHLVLGARSRSGRWVYRGFDPPGTGQRSIPVYVTDTSGEHPQLLARFPWDGADSDGIDVGWAGDRVLVTTHVACGGDDLYAAPVSGGPARRLTHRPGDFELPAGSPDGTRIAYSAGIACGHGASIHLETIGRDGTHRTRVTDEGDDDGSFDEHAAWSPEGAQLVFVHGTFATETLDAVDSAGGTATTLANLDHSTSPAQPTDGVHYGYVQQGGVLTFPLTGGPPTRIAATPTGSDDANCGNSGTVAWSPDGSQIAIGWTGGIWTLRLGTNTPWRLAIHMPCAGDPSFSPDGRRIAFDAPHPGRSAYQTDVFVADADGTRVHTVSAAPFRQSVHPTWLAG
jgi:Tol biopolymer transport system component